MAELSIREKQFLDAWREHGTEGDPESQYRVEGIRGPFDFAFPLCKILIEIHGWGGGGSGGRHQRPGGQSADAAKVRAAMAQGWTVIPVTTTCMGSKAKREDLIHEVLTIIGAQGTWGE